MESLTIKNDGKDNCCFKLFGNWALPKEKTVHVQDLLHWTGLGSIIITIHWAKILGPYTKLGPVQLLTLHSPISGPAGEGEHFYSVVRGLTGLIPGAFTTLSWPPQMYTPRHLVRKPRTLPLGVHGVICKPYTWTFDCTTQIYRGKIRMKERKIIPLTFKLVKNSDLLTWFGTFVVL